MNWNMVQLLTATAMPMSERIAYSLRMLVVGLGMVFVVLAILWGVLVLSRILLHDIPERRKNKTGGQTEANISVAKPLPQTETTPAPVSGNNNDVLVAVITAAIAATMAEQGNAPAGGFRVVSFRRASGNRAWNSK